MNKHQLVTLKATSDYFNHLKIKTLIFKGLLIQNRKKKALGERTPKCDINHNLSSLNQAISAPNTAAYCR
ncbi:hypothetical protein AAOGI_13470 [Agarivorans albus]